MVLAVSRSVAAIDTSSLEQAPCTSRPRHRMDRRTERAQDRVNSCLSQKDIDMCAALSTAPPSSRSSSRLLEFWDPCVSTLRNQGGRRRQDTQSLRTRTNRAPLFHTSHPRKFPSAAERLGWPDQSTSGTGHRQPQFLTTVLELLITGGSEVIEA